MCSVHGTCGATMNGIEQYCLLHYLKCMVDILKGFRLRLELRGAFHQLTSQKDILGSQLHERTMNYGIT